jgi:ribosomal protein S19E (S16A)
LAFRHRKVTSMSRGLGPVQRNVLTYLRREPLGRENGVVTAVATSVIADVAYGHRSRRLLRKGHASSDERKSVQRALRSLERRGLVERDPWRSGQESRWRLTP